MASNQSGATYRALPQTAEEEDGRRPVEARMDVDSEDDALEETQVPTLPQEERLDPKIRWINFMLGSAVLLPWNAMITAVPYFVARLEGSAYKNAFSSYLSSTFTLANFVVLAYATVTSKQASSTQRVRFSTLWLALLLFLLALTTFTHFSPTLFFTFVILNGVLQATAGSYLQASVIATASLFGPAAMQSVMAGQAAVAVVVSAIQLISSAASLHTSPSAQLQANVVEVESAEEKAALAFFSLSTVFLLATAAAHAWFVRTAAYKSVVVPFEHHSRALVRASSEHRRHRSLSSVSAEEVDLQKHRLVRVFRNNLTYYAAAAYVFIVTLAVFPPITVSIMPTNPSTAPLLFTAIHFLVFNTGDYVGRSLCAFPRLHLWSAPRLLTLSALRTVFIPLFLLCNVQPRDGAPVISSDWFYMFLLLAFGISNGYVGSMCMMAAPSLEHNERLEGRQDDVDTAGTLGSFSIVGGLLVGSIASFGVRSAVCGCNPFIE